MSHLENTKEILSKSESSGEVLKHLCLLNAQLLDVMTDLAARIELPDPVVISGEHEFKLDGVDKKKSRKKPVINQVPVQAIIDLYNKTANHLPQVRIVPDKTKNYIRRAWKEHKQMQSVLKWGKLFIACENNLFLSGRMDTNRTWKANLTWIVNPNNLAKIVNGNYAEHDSAQ